MRISTTYLFIVWECLTSLFLCFCAVYIIMLYYRMEKTWNILERIWTLLKTVQLCLHRVKERSQLKLFVQHMIPSKQKLVTTLFLLFVSTILLYILINPYIRTFNCTMSYSRRKYYCHHQNSK